MNRPVLIAAMVASIVMSAAASTASAESIGSAVRIVNTVTGSLDQQQRNLATGDNVSQNEAIEVASDALGEFKLRDDTKLALGPGSRLVLDKFVYNPAPSAGAVGVNLVKGAFRFITGLSRKGDYQLRTPSATITVRGTIFDVYVDDAGGTWLLLLEGSVRVCNTANQCTNISNPCGVVHVSPSGALDGPQGWPAQTRPINFATAFPFVVTPPTIDPSPLFTRTAVESNQCAKPIKPQTQQAQAPPTPSYQPPQQKYSAKKAMPYTAPVVPPPVVIKNFAGAYVGLVAGAVGQRNDPYLGCNDFTNSPPSVCSTQVSFGIPGNAFEANTVGFTGGAEVGYNFRTGNIVLGVEGDISYTDIDFTGHYDQSFVFPCCTVVWASSMHQSLNSLSTVRARFGYAFDNVLIYGTGGLAVGQVEYEFRLNFPDVGGPGLLGVAGDEKSKLAVGYTGGAGIEVGFGPWSLKTEYFFYNLGDETLNAPFTIAGAPQPFAFRPHFVTEGQVVRVGTNFRLN
jgi:opacity protein-like surface antigen